jgi:hypothetical protein
MILNVLHRDRKRVNYRIKEYIFHNLIELEVEVMMWLIFGFAGQKFVAKKS